MTFTDKKPTAPGAYAIQLESGEEDLVRVYAAKRTSKLEFEGVNTWGGVEDKGILWSSLLVPVDYFDKTFESAAIELAAMESTHIRTIFETIKKHASRVEKRKAKR